MKKHVKPTEARSAASVSSVAHLLADYSSALTSHRSSLCRVTARYASWRDADHGRHNVYRVSYAALSKGLATGKFNVANYRGVCVRRYSNGQIYNVQIATPQGNSSTVSLFDYHAMEIEPPIDQLPDAEEYFAKPNHP